jgi:hypothetical protein
MFYFLFLGEFSKKLDFEIRGSILGPSDYCYGLMIVASHLDVKSLLYVL